MKKVIKESNNFVTVNNVDDNKYYGFILGDSSPGYISADCMISNIESYNARFFNAMTKGNPWLNDSSSLHECIEEMLNTCSSIEIFEFETYQELFEWASIQN